MKTITVLILLTCLCVTVSAREWYPSGNETYFISPFGADLDENREVINAVQRAWRSQGYEEGLYNEWYL